MPTNTTNYSFKKPVVGADEDLWGGYINDNLDDLDSLLGDGAPLHIDSTNNRVGVGTASPASVLHTYGNGVDNYLTIDSNQSWSGIQFQDTGVTKAALYMNHLSSYLRLDTNGSERMRIDADGRLLLNTGGAYTYANNRFQVNAGSGQYAAYFYKTNTADEITTGFRHAGATGSTLRTLLYFQSASGGTVGTIKANGSSTSYNTSSDYRLKEDVQPMTGASDRVLALKPCNFAWKDGGSRVDGFLAHEAQEVVPEAVTGEKDAMRTEEYEVTPAVYEDVIIPAVLDADGNEVEPERTEQRLVSEAVMGTREVPDYQGIDQSKLVPLLTAALQEALGEIESLKARLDAIGA